MTTVVTGATGHLGANLVRALLAEGRPVRVVTLESPDEPVPSLRHLDVERVQADICDMSSLVRAFRGADVVYHTAARVSIVSWDRALVHAVNVDGTANVVEACLARDVRRLVHVGSVQAHSPFPLDEVVDEARAPSLHPKLSAYSRSKALGARVVLDGVRRGLDAVIVEPTTLIGPWDLAPSALGRNLRAVWRRRLPAVVPGGFDWADVRDVVAGALAAEAHGRTGERYLLGGTWASIGDLVRLAAVIAGVPAPRAVVPMTLARAGVRAAYGPARLLAVTPNVTPEALMALSRYRHVSRAKAEAELGYEARPLATTLADTFEWFVAHGLLPSRRAAAVATVTT